MVSCPRCHYRLSRNFFWFRGTGKLYDNSKNALGSEKNTPSFFLDQLQAMFNSNEVLIYLSDYRFAIFIRIAV